MSTSLLTLVAVCETRGLVEEDVDDLYIEDLDNALKTRPHLQTRMFEVIKFHVPVSDLLPKASKLGALLLLYHTTK